MSPDHKDGTRPTKLPEMTNPFDDPVFKAYALQAGYDRDDVPESYDPDRTWEPGASDDDMPGMPRAIFVAGDEDLPSQITIHLPSDSPIRYERKDGKAHVVIDGRLPETVIVRLIGGNLSKVAEIPGLDGWVVRDIKTTGRETMLTIESPDNIAASANEVLGRPEHPA